MKRTYSGDVPPGVVALLRIGLVPPAAAGTGEELVEPMVQADGSPAPLPLMVLTGRGPLGHGRSETQRHDPESDHDDGGAA